MVFAGDSARSLAMEALGLSSLDVVLGFPWSVCGFVGLVVFTGDCIQSDDGVARDVVVAFFYIGFCVGVAPSEWLETDWIHSGFGCAIGLDSAGYQH